MHSSRKAANPAGLVSHAKPQSRKVFKYNYPFAPLCDFAPLRETIPARTANHFA